MLSRIGQNNDTKLQVQNNDALRVVLETALSRGTITEADQLAIKRAIPQFDSGNTIDLKKENPAADLAMRELLASNESDPERISQELEKILGLFGKRFSPAEFSSFVALLGALHEAGRIGDHEDKRFQALRDVENKAYQDFVKSQKRKARWGGLAANLGPSTLAMALLFAPWEGPFYPLTLPIKIAIATGMGVSGGIVGAKIRSSALGKIFKWGINKDEPKLEKNFADMKDLATRHREAA